LWLSGGASGSDAGTGRGGLNAGVGVDGGPSATPTPTPSSSPTPTLSGGPTEVVNALAHNGAWLPLYRSTNDAVAFASNGGKLAAFDEKDGTRWSINVGDGAIKSGFDLDDDGTYDVAHFTAVPDSSCNQYVLYKRTVSFYSGKTGGLLTSSSLVDRCLTINGGASVQAQILLSERSVQYGRTPGNVVLAPAYSGVGWFLHRENGALTAPYFYDAETSAFDAYTHASPNPFGGAGAFVENSQPLHGIVSGNAYVAFTSGRALAYAIGSYGSEQLTADTTFVGASGIAGRSYGLISEDVRGRPELLALVAGASANVLYTDYFSSRASGVINPGADVWAAIERHVTVYDRAANSIRQKFVSYAHADGNAHAYTGRILFPATTLLPSAGGAGSHIVYNHFDGATWNANITAAGDVETATLLANTFVWDIVARGADDADVIASPIDTTNPAMVPDFVNDAGTPQSWRSAAYFPKAQLDIYKWHRSTGLAFVRSISDRLPYLGVPFSTPGQMATSEAAHFQSVRGLDTATRTKPVLTTIDSAGTWHELAYDW
jgi:hypothetical protein